MKLCDICLSQPKGGTNLVKMECNSEGDAYFLDCYDVCDNCIKILKSGIKELIHSKQPRDIIEVCGSLTPDQIIKVKSFINIKARSCQR